MPADIVRSQGVSTGYVGLMAGGGRSGATEELDQAVARAAEALRDAYGIDVTIRFNSDRMSGGAWLVTDPVDGIGRNSDIGVRFNLFDVERSRAHHARYGDMDVFRDMLRRDGHNAADAPAFYLRIHAYVGTSALRDPASATDMPSDPDRRYAYVQVPDVDAALDFLLAEAVAPEGSKPAAAKPGPR